MTARLDASARRRSTSTSRSLPASNRSRRRWTTFGRRERGPPSRTFGGVPTLVAVKDGDPSTRIDVPFAVGFYDRDPAGTLVRRPAGDLTVRVLLTRLGFLGAVDDLAPFRAEAFEADGELGGRPSPA